MGAKYLRNITKILKSASGVLFGRATAGNGRGEELTPTQVRNLLSVYTVTQTDTAISTAVNNLIGGSPGLLDTLDELAAALGDDANFAATVTTALAGKVDSSSLSESIDDRVAALLVAGTNISLTYNDASGTLTVASTAGGLSGTGSVDNAVLRADGTGGATLQSSAIVIDDLYTSSPNNTVNYVCLKPTGGTTNVGVAITPKGDGAFCFSVPDAASTGGNARGVNAIDLQRVRNAANQVASGELAVLLGGRNNRVANGYNWGTIVNGNSNVVTGAGAAILSGNACTASGTHSVVANGNNNVASGEGSVVGCGVYNTASGTYAGCFGGETNTASGTYAFVGSGAGNTASGTGAWICGGLQAVASRYGMSAHAAGQFAAAGDAQSVRFVARNRTANSTPTTLFLDGASTRLTIPAGKVFSFNARVTGVKSDGSAVADFMRCGVVKNVGGTTSLVGAIQTLGTDIEDNASTDVAITANDSNDALQINVTGIAGETWRWVAVVEGLEIAYGA